MGLFDIFKEKTKTRNATPNLFQKTKHSSNSERKYIYLYGSELGASNIVGNIEVVNDIPYIITNTDGGREETEWGSVIEKAKSISLPAYYWIKDITEANWQQYSFTLCPHEQPKDIDSIKVFVFPNKSPYSNPVFFEIVIGKCDNKPHIRYSVANGHSGHDPWFVSVSQPIIFEDIRALATELNLSKYTNINEANWMDKIQTFGGSNVYQIPNGDTICDVLTLLVRKQLQPSEIECIPIFTNQSLEKKTVPIKIFDSTFTGNWRIYSFKVKCHLTDNFTVYIDGLTKEVVASWPVNIKEMLS